VTIGPVIENGFYYDFAYKRPFTPEDLAAIEKRMAELAKKDFPVTREVWPRDKAVEFFKSIGEHYKAELIAAIPAGRGCLALSRGRFHRPVPRSARAVHRQAQGLQADEGGRRLLARRPEERDAAAHLRHGLGEEGRTRCLSAHAGGSREARPSQARRQLDLFHLQEEAPGMVFWHPHGWTVWQEVEQYMRRVYRDNGYQEVRCPQILDRSLWEKLRPLGAFQAEHVHHRIGKPRLRGQADELPGPCADFQYRPALLPRTAAAPASSVPATATSRRARCTA
jgi:threonyl-tRNA synthetase